jgi:hypothetical protein
VFKLTSKVYLVTLKVYVKMRCSSKVGCVKVGELITFAVLTANVDLVVVAILHRKMIL